MNKKPTHFVYAFCNFNSLMSDAHIYDQFDVHGDVFGLLAAHPIAPLLSLHHLDLVEPILPNMNRVQALQHLYLPMKLDSAAILQQSICYDQSKSWTVSVSWGYAVQILRGILSPREMEMPPRTFLNWRPKVDFTGYPFNTRPQARNLCQKPFVYYLSSCVYDQSTNRTVSEYLLHRIEYPDCHWKMANPSEVERVEVHKRPDPYMWDKVMHYIFSIYYASLLMNFSSLHSSIPNN